MKLGSVSVAAVAENAVEKEASRAPARNYWKVKGWFLSSCAHISWHLKCLPCAKVQEQKNKLVGTGPSLSFFQNFPRILSLIHTKIIWRCVLKIPPRSPGKWFLTLPRAFVGSFQKKPPLPFCGKNSRRDTVKRKHPSALCGGHLQGGPFHPHSHLMASQNLCSVWSRWSSPSARLCTHHQRLHLQGSPFFPGWMSVIFAWRHPTLHPSPQLFQAQLCYCVVARSFLWQSWGAETALFRFLLHKIMHTMDFFLTALNFGARGIKPRFSSLGLVL